MSAIMRREVHHDEEEIPALQRFINNGAVDFDLKFANGEEQQFANKGAA